MNQNIPPLPPGFELEPQAGTAPTPAAGGVPPLPPGFQMEQAAPAAPAVKARPTAQVQAEYDAMPWYAKAGRAADDIVRLIADGMTFGYADKLAGMMSGDGTAAERAKTTEASARAGNAGTVAQVGGAILPASRAASAGATLIGRFGTQRMRGIGGLAARSGLAAAEGAGYGALNAAGHDQSVSDGAILGAVLGGAGNTAVEGVTKAVGAATRNLRPAAPSQAELGAARDAAYQAADNAGVIYTPEAISRVGNRIQQELADMGYDPALQPGAAAVLNRLQGMQGNVTLKGLDTLRKVANNGYVAGNASNDRAINIIIRAIDDMAGNPQAGDILATARRPQAPTVDGGRVVVDEVVGGAPAAPAGPALPPGQGQQALPAPGGSVQPYNPNMNAPGPAGPRVAPQAEPVPGAAPQAADDGLGNAQDAAALLEQARDLARRAFKANEIDNAVVRAERRAGSTGRGGNIDNATRQNLRQILDRGARGYTPEEQQMIERVVMGTPMQNAARWAASFAPQNGVVGASGGAYLGSQIGKMFGPSGEMAGMVAGPAIGYIAKRGADAMTRSNVDDLIYTIMSGAAPQNPVLQALERQNPALARSVMAGANSRAQGQ